MSTISSKTSQVCRRRWCAPGSNPVPNHSCRAENSERNVVARCCKWGATPLNQLPSTSSIDFWIHQDSNSGRKITAISRRRNPGYKTTGEVVAHMDIEYEDGMEVYFSPDEDQVALLSNTRHHIMHPEKCVLFDFRYRSLVWEGHLPDM